MNAPTLPFRKWLAWGGKLAVVALVVWFVWGTVTRAFAQLGERHWTLDKLQPGWLVLAAILYFLGTVPCGWFWHRLMHALGQRPTLLESLRAYTIGQLGKYVPGKALVVVLRAELVKSSRTSRLIAGLVVFVETLTMMAVGGFLAGAILLVTRATSWPLVVFALGMMLVMALPTMPPVFRLLLDILPGLANRTAHAQLKQIDAALIARGWAAIAVGWLVLGLASWATLRGIGVATAEPIRDLPLLTAATALAIVAGFVSQVPGGLLVREAVITEVLKPAFGEANALVLAIVQRLVSVLSEVGFSIILYSLVRPADVTEAAAEPVADTNPTRERG